MALSFNYLRLFAMDVVGGAGGSDVVLACVWQQVTDTTSHHATLSMHAGRQACSSKQAFRDVP